MICSVEYLYEQYDMHVRCCWSTDFVGRPRKQEVELNAVYIITELLSSPASTRFFFFFLMPSVYKAVILILILIFNIKLKKKDQ